MPTVFLVQEEFDWLSQMENGRYRPVPAARISPELPFNSQNAFAHGVIADTRCQLTSESCLMAS
jgi:hypothetical protein